VFQENFMFPNHLEGCASGDISSGRVTEINQVKTQGSSWSSSLRTGCEPKSVISENYTC
jgi:hypothetical protein